MEKLTRDRCTPMLLRPLVVFVFVVVNAVVVVVVVNVVLVNGKFHEAGRVLLLSCSLSTRMIC